MTDAAKNPDNRLEFGSRDLCPACGEDLERFDPPFIVHHVPPGRWTLKEPLRARSMDMFEGCKKGGAVLDGDYVVGRNQEQADASGGQNG